MCQTIANREIIRSSVLGGTPVPCTMIQMSLSVLQIFCTSSIALILLLHMRKCLPIPYSGWRTLVPNSIGWTSITALFIYHITERSQPTSEQVLITDMYAPACRYMAWQGGVFLAGALLLAIEAFGFVVNCYVRVKRTNPEAVAYVLEQNMLYCVRPT